MLCEWDDACFVLQVVDWCCTSAPCGNPESCVFCGFDFPSVGFCNVRVPGRVCVCDDGSNVLFIDLCDVFFGVAVGAVCESPKHV